MSITTAGGIRITRIIIASWMLAVVGIILIIIGAIKLKIDMEDSPFDVTALGLLAVSVLDIGLIMGIYGIVPYLQYLPCITIIP